MCLQIPAGLATELARQLVPPHCPADQNYAGAHQGRAYPLIPYLSARGRCYTECRRYSSIKRSCPDQGHPFLLGDSDPRSAENVIRAEESESVQPPTGLPE